MNSLAGPIRFITALSVSALLAACSQGTAHVADIPDAGTTGIAATAAEPADPETRSASQSKPADASIPGVGADATAAAESSTAMMPQQISLAVGASAKLAPATRLTLDRIVNDSRCPPGQQCIWAGEVTLGFTLTDHDGASAFELSQSKPSATVRQVQVTLEAFGACGGGKSGKGGASGPECASLSVGPP